jgi:hypothetical protein
MAAFRSVKGMLGRTGRRYWSGRQQVKYIVMLYGEARAFPAASIPEFFEMPRELESATTAIA